MPRIIEDTSDSATGLLSPTLREGMELALHSGRAPAKIPKTTSSGKKLSKVDREKIVQAFDEAFELIGGVPRLALWANENPGKFFALYARHAAKEQKHKHSGEIKFIKPAFGPSALDGDPSTLEGEFIEHSDPELHAQTSLPSLSSEE